MVNIQHVSWRHLMYSLICICIWQWKSENYAKWSFIPPNCQSTLHIVSQTTAATFVHKAPLHLLSTLTCHILPGGWPFIPWGIAIYFLEDCQFLPGGNRDPHEIKLQFKDTSAYLYDVPHTYLVSYLRGRYHDIVISHRGPGTLRRKHLEERDA